MMQRARAGAAVLVACILVVGCSTPGEDLVPPEAEQVGVSESCGSDECGWNVVVRVPGLRGEEAVEVVAAHLRSLVDEEGCPTDGGDYCVTSSPQTLPAFVDGLPHGGDLALGFDWRDRYPEERDALVVFGIRER